jgi:hypothetical protein
MRGSRLTVAEARAIPRARAAVRRISSGVMTLEQAKPKAPSYTTRTPNPLSYPRLADCTAPFFTETSSVTRSWYRASA